MKHRIWFVDQFGRALPQPSSARNEIKVTEYVVVQELEQKLERTKKTLEFYAKIPWLGNRAKKMLNEID